MTMTLHHGAHTAYTLHIGQCYTDDLDSAERYARQGSNGVIGTIEIDMDGLTVIEVDAYDRDTDTAMGDSAADTVDADVIYYEDEDPSGMPHMTWRLMSARAVEAAAVVKSEEGDDA